MKGRFLCVLLSAVLVFAFSACAEKQVKTVEMEKPAAAEQPAAQPAVKQEPAVEKVASARPAAESGAAASEEKAAAAQPEKEKKEKVLDSYVVKKGDCLWRIAEYKDIYGDAFLWPVIFDANKKVIKNANRIYPGQKLSIPREGLSMDAVKKARKKAGAPKPYTPPEGSKAPVG